MYINHYVVLNLFTVMKTGCSFVEIKMRNENIIFLFEIYAADGYWSMFFYSLFRWNINPIIGREKINKLVTK